MKSFKTSLSKNSLRIMKLILGLGQYTCGWWKVDCYVLGILLPYFVFTTTQQEQHLPTFKVPYSKIGVSEPDPPPERGLSCVLKVLGLTCKFTFFSSSANSCRFQFI